jgi:hypothetical protein
MPLKTVTPGVSVETPFTNPLSILIIGPPGLQEIMATKTRMAENNFFMTI